MWVLFCRKCNVADWHFAAFAALQKVCRLSDTYRTSTISGSPTAQAHVLARNYRRPPRTILRGNLGRSGGTLGGMSGR